MSSHGDSTTAVGSPTPANANSSNPTSPSDSTIVSCPVPAAPNASIEKLANGDFSIDFSGGTAATIYSIQASDDLSTWLTIGSATADSNGSFSFEDTHSAAHAVRFYRAFAISPEVCCTPNKEYGAIDCHDQIPSSLSAARQQVCSADGRSFVIGSCAVTSCAPGYYVDQQQACLPQTCTPGSAFAPAECTNQIANAAYATQSTSCNSDGSGQIHGPCTLGICNPGFIPVGDNCTAGSALVLASTGEIYQSLAAFWLAGSILNPPFTGVVNDGDNLIAVNAQGATAPIAWPSPLTEEPASATWTGLASDDQYLYLLTSSGNAFRAPQAGINVIFEGLEYAGLTITRTGTAFAVAKTGQTYLLHLPTDVITPPVGTEFTGLAAYQGALYRLAKTGAIYKTDPLPLYSPVPSTVAIVDVAILFE